MEPGHTPQNAASDQGTQFATRHVIFKLHTSIGSGTDFYKLQETYGKVLRCPNMYSKYDS